MSDLPSTPRLAAALDVALATVAVALHLVAGWLVSVSGLLAPLWAVVVLGAVWLGACVPLVHAVRTRARWAVAVPVATLLVWGALLTLGDLVLGWTA